MPPWDVVALSTHRTQQHGRVEHVRGRVWDALARLRALSSA